MKKRWESPIEHDLMVSLRLVGLQVEHQVWVGAYRLDMIVSSRLNSQKLIVECDGKDFHHHLIDDFRDDELRESSGYPVVHITGSAITYNAEECVVQIVDRWFPEHSRLVGYSQLCDISFQRDNHIVSQKSGTSGAMIRSHGAVSLREKREMIRKSVSGKKTPLHELARLYILEEHKDNRFPDLKERQLRELEDFVKCTTKTDK
jgi:very-short-patch-repair endonuclease